MVDGQSQDIIIGSGAVIGTPGGPTGFSDQEVLDEGYTYLLELHRFLLQTAETYRAGDDRKGRELFMELIQGMEWFVKIASTIEAQLKIDFTMTHCAGRTLRESVDGLNGILMEIIGAQQHSDWVLLTDLLEYELAPQLELWQEIFTTLKQDRLTIGSGECLPA
jgi:hypothetical protein